KIAGALENNQVKLLNDVAMLDKLYELNKVFFKVLSMYILAGKKKLAEVEATELPALAEKAKQTNLPEDAQAANDLASLCSRFEKKLHDLELTRMISIQMAPQIRLVQSNDTLMSEKIQSTLVNTIPLWKSQMVLALGITHSQQAAQAQHEVTDMTNELLRKNAATLKMATVETAKESERGIVDIETLRNTNENLISTLDEVLRIQQEGRQMRKEAEQELSKIEGELKQKLLDIRR
ncbi:MAG: toxic anion resistance protein, partial [Hydrogeniiclostridium mannosilyticum]